MGQQWQAKPVELVGEQEQDLAMKKRLWGLVLVQAERGVAWGGAMLHLGIAERTGCTAWHMPLRLPTALPSTLQDHLHHVPPCCVGAP